MRIMILSQYYDPEPVAKPGEIARELRSQGHETAVITGFPNDPSGRLYDGYRLRLVRRETCDEVPFVRTFEFPYHGKSVIGRLVNYGSFVLFAPLGALFGGRGYLRQNLRKNVVVDRYERLLKDVAESNRH